MEDPTHNFLLLSTIKDRRFEIFFDWLPGRASGKISVVGRCEIREGLLDGELCGSIGIKRSTYYSYYLDDDVNRSNLITKITLDNLSEFV